MTTETVRPSFALADRFVDELVVLDPLEATYLGVRGHDHRWPDLGPEGTAAHLDLYRRTRTALDGLPEPVDDADRLNRAVMARWLDDAIAEIESGDPFREVRHLGGTFEAVRDVFDLMDTETVEGWENIVSRLATMGEALAGYRARLEVGVARGLVAARRQAESVADQARVFASTEGSLRGLVARFDASPVAGDVRLRRRLVDAVDAATVAVLAFAEWMGSVYGLHAASADAVGRERYVRAASRYLGMAVDPEEAYAWGWTEIARIHQEMLAVAEAIVPGGTLDDALHAVRTEPERMAPTQAAFLEMMRARQAEALERLDGTHFDVPAPLRRVEVRLAAPGSALGAYYVAPSEDLTRPGTIFWSLGALEPVPLYEEVSTGYHEGFPGHHLQGAYQVYLRDRLSRFQRLIAWWPGTGEGWALYAERLMDELGFLDRPDYVLGMLVGQMLRAVRVVVDIGSHLALPIPSDAPFEPGERWTFDRGVAALMRLAHQRRDVAASEMTRYLGWPGQAIAYKLGEREILALRDEVRRRDGDAFDPKAFHARMLSLGSVPLALLRSGHGRPSRDT